MLNESDLGPLLSGRLGYLFKRAQRALDGLHDELLAPSGINVRELAVLMLLDARDPESQQQVAGRLGVDRTTMVALLDTLEEKALVARRPDEADRRRNVLELTDAGRQVLRRATSASDEAETRLLDALNADEAEQLRGLLQRIAAS